MKNLNTFPSFKCSLFENLTNQKIYFCPTRTSPLRVKNNLENFQEYYHKNARDKPTAKRTYDSKK